MADLNAFLTAFHNLRQAFINQKRKASVTPILFWIVSVFPAFCVSAIAVYIQSVSREDTRMTCISSRDGIDTTLHSNCYYRSYTRPSIYNHPAMIAPGVGGTPDPWEHLKKPRNELHKVPICHLILGVFGFIPIILWKILEGGKTNEICEILDQRRTSQASPQPEANMDRYSSEAAKLFCIHLRGRYFFMAKFILCKALALSYPFVWVLCTSLIFDSRIVILGVLLLNPSEDKIHVLDDMFPDWMHCDTKIFGPSGNLDVVDSLCHYPLNRTLHYIYPIEWCMYVIFAFVSICGTVHFVLTSLGYPVNALLMANRMQPGMNVICKAVMREIGPGGYVMLTLIQGNVNALTFKAFLEKVNEELFGLNSML